jgi:hypothetical protein
LLHETLLAAQPLLTTLGNPLIRRRALVDVGGLEDEFTGLAEDAVLWCKLALQFPFSATASTTLEYRRHEMASSIGHAGSSNLAEGRARFARWFYAYVERQPPAIRSWAQPIAAEHLFRSVLLEAWQSHPERSFDRRVRLARAWTDLRRFYPEVITSRRYVRLAAQISAGLRSGALRALQEPMPKGTVT